MHPQTRQLADTEELLLVLAAQSGDRDAFRKLVDRYERRLLYFIRRLLGRNEGALDILQDVWLAIHRRLRELRSPGQFRSWAYQIARGRTVDVLRRNRRERELLQSLAEDEAETSGEDVADDFGDAEAIHLAMAEMSAPHREALTLHFLEDMTVEEMAAVVGRPAGTMKTRLFHAKRQLRAILEKSHHAESRTGRPE